ncbi:MAG: radical SAM protein [Methanocorpusculum sp.]|nr:radical SAM protein [Methanocorpusculum sp.]
MHYKEAKSILSAHNGAANGMNIYRGCSHGCIYCDSRSVCYHMEHDFEDIEVKINAPALLEQALSKKRSRCMIGTGAMCDPYIPLEESLCLTRKCLEIIERRGFGLYILTKSDRILRDLDLLKKINSKAKTVAAMTLTTADDELCKIIEPNVCVTSRRVEVLKIMHEVGIPTIVWLCPILPFINDTEENIRNIVKMCADAGVYGILCFGMGVTLREGNREYFYKKLDEHFKGLREVYEKKYGDTYSVPSDKNKELMKIFCEECGNAGIVTDTDKLFSYMETFEDKGQRTLF